MLLFTIISIFYLSGANAAEPDYRIFHRAPYVQHVTPTEFSILWETVADEECTVTARGLDSHFTQTEKSKGMDHEVRFTGLAPGHRYQYVVKSGEQSFSSEVKTAITGDDPFTFLVFGDNRNGYKVHQTIVNMMALEKASFYINTGDLVEDGLVRKNWMRYLRIENILMRKMPLYPTVGNHENCFGMGEKMWQKYFALPKNGPLSEKTYWFDWGNSRFIFLDTNQSFMGSRQFQWFSDILKETELKKEIRHIFVLLHHSPYTSGPHGPNTDLIDSGAVSLMKKFGVSMTFAAHDHIYERGKADGLNYIVTGGGGAPIYFVKTKMKYSLIAEPVNHYIRVMVNKNTIEYRVMRMDGTLLDFYVSKRIDHSERKPVQKTVKASVSSTKTDFIKTDAAMEPVPQETSSNEPETGKTRSDYFYTILMIIAGILGFAGLFIYRSHSKITIK
ncbi:metallophosphoesterase family protein [Myxococcota bacterium]|nr:metallophosphoesterase family protein [Myxococcota bacterium]MBU1381248.1 metallophosphoesterase family protein [Myxococcota bacterium]MBU1498884.1 metallophosphoesterase family protein [Myxococcota bacterium]